MKLNSRLFVLAAGLLVAVSAAAHHGWSSFDQDKPIFVAGTIKQVRWQNPHAEVVITVADTAVPADLATRSVPAQQQSVDGAGILKRAQRAPATGDWELEFAPMSRMSAWGLQQAPAVGDRIEAVGYALSDGKQVLRVEYLFLKGKAYALRSGPVN